MDADTGRALSDVAEILDRAVRHHRAFDEFTVGGAGWPTVRYTPLTLALADALDTVRGLLDADAIA